MFYPDSFVKHRDLKSQRIKSWIDRFFNISDFNKKPVFADLGCGTGRFTLPLAKHVYQAYGVDIDNNMLEIARKKPNPDSVTWIQADALDSGLSQSSIDVVLTSMLLEHLINLSST